MSRVPPDVSWLSATGAPAPARDFPQHRARLGVVLVVLDCPRTDPGPPMPLARFLPFLACTLPWALPAVEKAPKQPASAPLLLVEDFEEVAAGQIPKAFTKQGAVGVVDDVAHSGGHALRMEAAVNGPRRITINDPKLMAALGGEHWGRLYFKVQLPVPVPKGEGKFPVIHS